MEWRASHILVKEKGLADDLRKRLKSGAKLGDLAKEFSTFPSKSKSVGFLSLDIIFLTIFFYTRLKN